MSRYENIDCPICNNSLGNGETVVVCPQCGAPYHIDCYKKSGECIFGDLHAANESWKPPHFEPVVEENAPINCVACGTVNPANGLFCRSCGSDLTSNKSIPYPQDREGMPIGGFPFPPFASPFEPISATEEIDGIKAADAAAFVGKNAQYYIHRFKQLAKSKGRYKIINWAGFFFMGWNFIFRKMYGIGILAIIVEFILNIPYCMILLTGFSDASLLTGGTINVDSLTTIHMVANLLIIFMRFLCGYYANTLYKKHAFKQINKIKQSSGDLSDDEYKAKLAKKGGIAMKLIFGIFITYMAICMLSMFVMMFSK